MMPGDQLFPDYDADEEDVFGSQNVMTAKRVVVTEQQKADPLRKPKVELQGILVAEKQPISAKDIERRMLDEYGQKIDPKKYGCKTLDELLQACSDTVVHKRRQDGVHVYWAKVSEANQDIVEMVQQQNNGHESKRAPRSFLTYGPTKGGRGNYGASFRAYRGQARVPEEDIKTKGNPDQVLARSKLAPAKTIERVHNMAELLRECRAVIGTPHPDQPGRMIVTLGQLMEKFKEVYGLPAWGKNMSESELHKQITVEKYAGVLKFWSLRDGGDYYVEDFNSKDPSASEKQKPPEEPIGKEKVVSETPLVTLRQNVNETTIAATPTNDEIAADRSLSIAPDYSFEEFSSISESSAAMLISEAKNDGFFESGPGFGGGLQRDTPPPQLNLNATSSMTDLGQRFGNVTLGRPQPSNENTATSNSVSRSGSRLGGAALTGNRQNTGHETRHRQSSSVQPMRPVSSSFGPRAIIPRNALKLLVKYVKSRGSAKYESLPDDDQIYVNFNCQIFKVYANQPGEMLVRLVDPTIDPETVKLSENNFREPVEADLRWMSEVNVHVKRGLILVRPVMFVAPRGFLMVVCNPNETHLESEKMARIEELLRGAMPGPLEELQRRNVRPGMAAVYIYRQSDNDVRYYRVLLVGRAQQGDDVMVLLADHNDQHMVDVKLSMLYPLPEKANFRRYAPNVYFGTLYGVMGMSALEQENMWKNLDDEDRKRFVAGYIPQDETRVLNVDMVWANENNQVEWLSQIAKRRGAIPSSDSNSTHVNKQPEMALRRLGEDSFMDFTDFTQQPPEEPNPPTLVVQNSRHPEPETFRTAPQPTAKVQSTSFNPRLLNMYSVFDELIETNNVVGMVQMVGTVKIIRNMKQSKSNADWKELTDYMVDAGHRKGIQLEL